MSRIQFFRVTNSTTLTDFLQQHVHLNHEVINFLIYYGAIYINSIRTINDITLQTGDLIRCHLEPKRYRNFSDWDKRILFENEHFIICDKPPGLPTQISLDNRIENLHFQMSEYKKQELLITHRLDIGTSGLILFAKTKLFQRHFNHLLESRKVLKIYEALCHGPLLPYHHLNHWMLPHARAPKIVSREAQVKWKPCELEILEAQQVTNTINFYKIKLHTGRTHQIRAQLSCEANPILGDELYGGQKQNVPYEWYALQCTELAFDFEDTNYHWNLPSIKIENKWT